MASNDTFSSDGQAEILDKRRLDYFLDQIRLIQLDPKADTESQSSIITASIGIFPLSKVPPYIALSYVWGTDEPSNTIMLDGQPMRVRNNLWNFLNTFCREENTSYLWIDALCINQSYDPERSHQVTLMGQIYTQATKVIAWSGVDPKLAEAVEDLARKDRVFRAYAVFYEADYWRRAWIQQEVLLAKSVEIRCQKATISPETVDKMMTDPRGLASWPPDLYTPKRVQNILHWRRDWLDGKQFRDISRIINVTWQKRHRLECGDPRDQVYSLLGLVDKETLLRHLIDVDYTITNFQLYERLAARHEKMKEEGWLNPAGDIGLLRFVLGVPKQKLEKIL